MGYCTNLISAVQPRGGGGDLKGNSPIYIIIIFLMVDIDVGKSLKKVGASQVP